MAKSKKQQLKEKSSISSYFSPVPADSLLKFKSPLKIAPKVAKKSQSAKRKAIVLEPITLEDSDDEIEFVKPKSESLAEQPVSLKKVKHDVVMIVEGEKENQNQELVETVLKAVEIAEQLDIKDFDIPEEVIIDDMKIEADLVENLDQETQAQHWGEDGGVDSDPERELDGEDWNEDEEDAELDLESYKAETSAFLDQIDEEEHKVVQGSSKDHDQKFDVKPLASVKKSTSSATKKLGAFPTFANPFSHDPAPPPPNAFTALMAGNKENKAWKDAETSDNIRGRGIKRSVPFYKWVEGMEITVDAFKYGKIPMCKAYFLSHAHSDHYQNLSSSWSGGPVYCSVTTANLIKLKLNVKDQYLKPLAMNVVHNIEGVSVTLIDANHCPGSTIFLFEGPHTDPKSNWSKYPKKIFRYLHCGDFRASPAHINHPALVGKRIDICYLDTTYLDPKYCFPAQDLVIEACSTLVTQFINGDKEALSRVGGAEQQEMGTAMKGWLEKGKGRMTDEVEGEEIEEIKEKSVSDWIEAAKPTVDGAEPKVSKDKWLVVVGTYSVGKERIVKGIAQALNTKIYANPTKMKLLKAQDDPVLHSLLTSNPLAAQVHVVFLSDITNEKLSVYLSTFRKMQGGFTKLIGLRPTGWTYRPEKTSDKAPITVAKIIEREKQRKFSPAGMIPQRDSKPGCLAYGVPYSEHSSMFELCCFAMSLNYVRMIPTVNVGKPESRARMNIWFDKWMVEKKRRKDQNIKLAARTDTYW